MGGNNKDKPRRKRRTKEEILDVTYEGGLKPGNIVVITTPSTFIGQAVGGVLSPQKWCPDGIPVAIQHRTYKTACIRVDLGDTIRKISK